MSDGCRQNAGITLREIQALATSQNLDSVLCDTALLRDVDLRHLMTDEERLCFYGNLLNLMMLHALTVCCTAHQVSPSYSTIHYLSLHFNGHFQSVLNSRYQKTWVSASYPYQNVSILVFIGAKDGDGGGNWSYKSCKTPVKSSPPTNQDPVLYRSDVLPVTQPTVSKHWMKATARYIMKRYVPDVNHSVLTVPWFDDVGWMLGREHTYSL